MAAPSPSVLSEITGCRSCDAPALTHLVHLGRLPLADALRTPGEETPDQHLYRSPGTLIDGWFAFFITLAA